jgi:uncharacterized linocin/CFP29 family protein
MKDYLMRDNAPFTEEQWEKIDDVVVNTAKNKLVGRKIIHIYGPLGGGIQSIELDTINLNGEAELDKFGYGETEQVEISERRFIPVPLIYKDFIMSWRDIENIKQLGRPFDYSLVAASASALAKKEDNIIFNGTKESEGIMSATGRLVVEKGNWSEGDTPYKDVAKAISNLMKNDSYEPHALVVSTDLYLKMQRIQEGTGVTILSRVKELVDGRVYQSPVIEEGKGVVVAIGPQHMDLVVGEDMVTAYRGDENLNHLFRVMESLALRIKRPTSICTIE